MERNITIPLKEYQCLREHLNLATKALEAISDALGENNASQVPKRLSKKEKIEKYSHLVGSGVRAKKPEQLKRK